MPRIKAPSKCKFLKSWLDPTSFPGFTNWLREVPNDVTSARCILCKSTFALSSMGIGAVQSHERGAKHIAAVKNMQLSADIRGAFKKGGNPGSASAASQEKSGDTSTTEQVAPSTCSTDSATPASQAAPRAPAVSTTGSIATLPAAPKLLGKERYLQVVEVTKAEILLVLYSVMTSSSSRDIGNLVNLLPLICPDSDVARRISLQKDKVCYTATYGLGPFVEKMVTDKAKTAKYLVVGFDESLNKVSQKEQMDIFLRFWDDQKEEVAARYYTSAFLGHTTAQDLLGAFTKALSNFDLHRMLQVSMDGPYVNWKFLKELIKSLESGEEYPILLNIGSCGLHVVNGSFKAGINSTGWNIIEFLQALYRLFKDVPARRAEYTRITKSSLFPKKFCPIRWTENTAVVERAISMLPFLKKYVKEANLDTASFQTVKNATQDKSIEVKLAFFYSLAAELEPFQTYFQSESPMAPYLYDDLLNLQETMMERFVKPEVLKQAKGGVAVSKIDVKNKDNLLPAKKVDVGFAVSKAFSKCAGLTEKHVLEIRQDIAKCLSQVVYKLQEKSPTKYSLTKGVSCLNPSIALKDELRKERLPVALTVLTNNRWISGPQADRIKRAFEVLCTAESTKARLASFNRKEDRLDHFWVQVLKANPDSREHLTDFVKLCLTLSHGNASLERGFSVNDNILVENLGEKSLIAQRQIYDFVKSCGSIKNVEITTGMIQYVKNAYSRYKDALEEKKKEDAAALEQKAKEKKIAQEIKNLQSKKVSVLESAQIEVRNIDAEVQNLLSKKK